MVRKQKAKINLLVYLLVVLIVFSAFTGFVYVGSARAESTYSDVLADLQMDENFDTALYPEIEDDYSLHVIQIAESTDDELLVYVYQPSGTSKDLRASSINIAISTENPTWVNYDLTFLNSNGVFYKYLVNDFTLSTDTTRYYSITSIFRPFDNDLDSELVDDNGTTIDEVAYEVARLYTVRELEGQVFYYCNFEQVVTITDKRVGYIRYSNNSNVWKRACDSHYVAFSTDYNIEKLLSVDIEYVTYTYTFERGVGDLPSFDDYTYGPDVTHPETLHYDDEVTVSNGAYFAKTYTWNRIETTAEFIENEGEVLSESKIEDLQDKQWVLRFYESDYRRDETALLGVYEEGTRVREVTILRLEFELDGITYNLGVVDNKSTGPTTPDGEHVDAPVLPEWLQAIVDWFNSIWNSIKGLFGDVLGAILLVIGAILLIVFFPYIAKFIVWLFKALWTVIKYVFAGIWWLITLPYRLITGR